MNEGESNRKRLDERRARETATNGNTVGSVSIHHGEPILSPIF